MPVGGWMSIRALGSVVSRSIGASTLETAASATSATGPGGAAVCALGRVGS